jgi:putative ABC transport system permease protein
VRAPPRWAERLLAAVLPGGGEAILGDLREEHAHRPSLAGDLWYVVEALRLAARYARDHRAARRPKGDGMGRVFEDARFALRGMAKRPGISVIAVATLALGIAADAAIFSSLDALVLQPLPFSQRHRLVRLWETSPGGEVIDKNTVAPANFADWQASSSGVFDRMVAIEGWDANILGREVSERVDACRVSPSFFETLGVTPPWGRGFLPGEGEPGADRSVVLGYDLWQRAFGGDPGILGRTVTVDREPYAVVGIAPAYFRFPEGTEMWAPLVPPIPGKAPRDKHELSVIARLAPGRSSSDAARFMDVVAARLQKEHPDTNAARRVEVGGLQRSFEDVGVRPLLALWQLAAGLVLLLACVNVANLLLARGAERQRELAVRAALGASRGELLRQLLTEGLVTALVAAVLSVPLTAWAAREMREAMPAEIVRFVTGWEGIGVHPRTLLFSVLIAALSTLVFALIPALKVSRLGGVEVLQEGGRGGSAGRGRQRGRSLLVVAQVAGALAIVVVAGLALKSARRLIRGPQGYDPDHLLTLQVHLSPGPYPSGDSRRDYARRAQDGLARIPGVTSVAYANMLPGRGENASRPIQIEGERVDRSNPPVVDDRAVSPGYFDTLRLPIVEGRGIEASDDERAAPVAVVSRSLAQRYWPGRDPIGRRFRIGDEHAPWTTVVGVSGDVVHQWFSRRNYPTSYRPFAQEPRSDVAYALRTAGEPEASIKAARGALESVDPYQPADQVWSMERSISLSTVGLQFVAGIMAVLGVLALVLAVSGVYAVMSYRVSLRSREFCVRVALGASSGDVLQLTMAQAVRLTALGLLLGGVAGLSAAEVLSSALMGTIPFDVATFGLATALLAGTALVAAYVPARRVLALEPAQALRSE